jgi:hypothetical protein
MFQILIFIFCWLHAVYANPDYNTQNIGVWLSGAAYCKQAQYKTMVLDGPAKGFDLADVLYDPKTDVLGYSGVHPSSESIFIVFRGSSSVLNWLADFEVQKVPYDSYKECDCTVHKGFYNATQHLRDSTVKSVKKLVELFPTYRVITTGHSLGAAMAMMMALELNKEIPPPVEIYNYGQPRVGEKKYADFANAIIQEQYRHTHNKDMVPHVPPIKGLDYYHSSQEVFEKENGVTVLCSEIDGEDPACSDQFSAFDLTTDDHSTYLGHYLSCESSTTGSLTKESSSALSSTDLAKISEYFAVLQRP